MASVHRYKRLENSVVRRISRAFRIAFIAIGRFFKGFFSLFGRKYTLMFVPHSEKKVYNFQINLLSIIALLLISASLVGVFAWYSTTYVQTAANLNDKTSLLESTKASLDQLRDETSTLLKSAKNFEVALGSTLDTLGIKRIQNRDSDQTGTGDLASFFEFSEAGEGSLKEIGELQRLSAWLDEAAKPVEELGGLLESQNALLRDIPSIWPIKGGIGHISQYFGQNPHPYTGQWYIHRGIDLSTWRQGDPVISTADGQVVTVAYEVFGFGNYIIVKHKHGYYTRYAHLRNTIVTEGQRVKQGQVVGYIGNTGMSTGPHLHYEVHVGSDVEDPLKYINMRASLSTRANRQTN